MHEGIFENYHRLGVWPFYKVFYVELYFINKRHLHTPAFLISSSSIIGILCLILMVYSLSAPSNRFTKHKICHDIVAYICTKLTDCIVHPKAFMRTGHTHCSLLHIHRAIRYIFMLFVKAAYPDMICSLFLHLSFCLHLPCEHACHAIQTRCP